VKGWGPGGHKSTSVTANRQCDGDRSSPAGQEGLAAVLERFDACGRAPGMGPFGHFGRGLERRGRFDQAIAEYGQAVETAAADSAFRSAVEKALGAADE
jgi:hypothetical protein